jgi:membrane-associated phospholipid phosphatase
MHFLRKNRQIFFLLPVIFIFTFYLDGAVLSWIKNFYAAHPGAQQVDHAIRPPIKILSHGTTLFALSLGLYLFGGSISRTLRDAGRTLFLGLLSAGISVQILKHIIGRARPSVTFDTVFIGPSVKYAYDSFPSGHTASAFCLAFIFSQFFPKYRGGFYLFGVIVALYRIDGLSHFPSDVMAGALLGTIVGKIIWMKSSGEKRHGEEAVRTPLDKRNAGRVS